MQTEPSTSNFLDDLLTEVEQKENQNTQAYHDLIAMEVIKLENEIATNFSQAEVECEIINNWALRKNAANQDRANLLKMKLGSFIRGEDKKTIDLPHALLKIRKSPDKGEITNLDEFLAHAISEMVDTVPETVKASITKLKSYMKMMVKFRK